MRHACDDKRSGCVEARRVPQRSERASEDLAHESGVVLGVPAGKAGDRHFGESEACWREVLGRCSTERNHAVVRPKAELISAAVTVHHVGSVHAEAMKCAGDSGLKAQGRHPKDLTSHAPRIRERSHEVENGADPEGLTNGRGMTHGGMKTRSEEERETRFGERAARHVIVYIELSPQRF